MVPDLYESRLLVLDLFSCALEIIYESVLFFSQGGTSPAMLRKISRHHDGVISIAIVLLDQALLLKSELSVELQCGMI